MKYLDEFRDPDLALRLIDDIARIATKRHVLMEVCGGQTHSIIRNGIDRLLPEQIEMVHGPGCPVCVTPLETIDKALAIASREGVIFCSFGDMLRVPGSGSDLFSVKSAGGDVRIVYSPLDAVQIARDNPDREVVFFGIGFETTAPANAMAVAQAQRSGLDNFSMLACHVLVPPAVALLLGSPHNRVQGFIAPGHVCSVMGFAEYVELSRRFQVPIVVGGFEPVDLLEAISMLVSQLEQGRAETENQYSRSVSLEGNQPARELIDRVFEVCDRKWRGVGPIPRSGLRLRPEYAAHDAEAVFDLSSVSAEEPAECLSAEVLQGLRRPPDCPAFASRCTPESPLGAPMVSGEGACAAYYRYRRHQEAAS